MSGGGYGPTIGVLELFQPVGELGTEGRTWMTCPDFSDRGQLE